MSSAAGAPARFLAGNGCFRSLAFLLALMALFGSKRAAAAERQQLAGHVPEAIQRMNLQSTGELPATNRLNLAIGLPLRNKSDLTALLHQLYDPASPNYRKYITPDQFAQRYGPAQEDYDRLKNFLTAQGLTVTATHPNRVLLDVNMSVADIQRVFHVKLRLYPHPFEHRAFYAPDAEPSIDLDLPILHISGLDNYRVPRPLIHKGSPLGQKSTGKALTGSGPDGNYWGGDFRAAYAPGVTLNGAGQSLALVEFDTYYPSDIATYEALTGLPNVPLINVPVDGFAATPGAGDGEVSLDIEVAVAMAPGLSRILVYEEDNGVYPINDIFNQIATDNLARQVSMSWTLTDDPTTDVIFEQMAAQGQSFFEGSGDQGSFNYASLTQTDRDDDPYITLVGGTTLTTTNNGAWLSEVVWNWQTEYPGQGLEDASGGGVSATYALPTWQRGINMTTNLGSATFRNVPDVALTADNIFTVDSDGVSETNIGGTSVATPLWAAFCAMINEKAALTGAAPVGFLNPSIYTIGKGLLYNASFHDITNGNNTNNDNPTLYFAVPGYDLCTGWGTPVGEPLIDAVVPGAINVPILSIVSNTLSGGNGSGQIDPDGCYSINVLITNQGSYAATNVQGILTSLTPGILIGASTAAYPNLPPGQSAWNETPFTLSTESSFVCGTTVNLQLVIKCGQTTQTSYLQYATGGVGAPVRFDCSTPLTVPPSDGIGAFSAIIVSNITTAVGKVTVSFYLLAPEDDFMAIELISPNGTIVPLALFEGGAGANYGTACSPDSSRTTFDDAATVPVYDGIAPMTGSYTPESPLSVYNLMTGTNVNGIWQLNVINLLTGVSTLQCWSLFISPEQCADGGGQCPGSDLSLTMKANPVTTPSFNPVIYSLSVTNAGPSPAPDTVVSMTIPAGMLYQGAVASQGTIIQTGSLLTFSLGTLGLFSNATMTVTTEAVEAGLWTSTAVVGATNANPNPAGSSTNVAVLVTKPLADLGLTLSADPISVPQDGLATFTIIVTNHGPAQALGVTVSNSLPNNVSVVSVSTSQGTISPGGTLASLGSLSAGAGATVTLVLSPTSVGTSTLTSTVGLSPSEIDPVLGNNTASASINALPAADLGVSVSVSPNPAIAGADFSYVVTVTNSGPADATSVFMNQTLPGGIIFVSTSSTNAVDISGLVTWTIGTVPSGTSQTLTNIVQAPGLLQGIVSNVLVSTFSVAGQPGDPNTNNNFESVSTVVLRPTVIIVPVGDNLAWESFQPPNGAVAPGETVEVAFQLENVGNIPTTNLVVTLQTNGGVIPMQTNSAGIPVAGLSSVNYGALAPGGGVNSGDFFFSNNAADGGTLVATLQLQDGPTNHGTVGFTFVMPVITTFWNTNLISIPATNFVATNEAMGPAGPFPSSNLVSGISNYVSDVSVTVSNLEHTYPSDISLWLVGPGGQSAMLMSFAAQYSSAAIPVTITFSNNASIPVPAMGSLYSGTYQPAEYSLPVLPPSLAGVTPPANTNLSVFDGVTPNGWWSLYAYDAKAGDYGAISNGWSVDLTTITPVNKITDMGVALAASTNQVGLGGEVAYTITITNLGTNAAAVYLTNVLGPGLTFVSNTLGPSPSLTNGQTQTYTNLGVLAAQTNMILGFVAVATNNLQSNSVVNDLVNIGSFLIDPNTNNNTASVPVTIILQADVFAAISSSAGLNPVVVGSNVIYTLTVSNGGPNLAFNVAGLLTQVVNGSTNTVFSTNFGSIAPGSSDSVQFATNAPLAPGSLSNIWAVSTGSTDTNPASSSIADVLDITYPEPIMAANGAALVASSFLPPDGALDPSEILTVALTLENTGAAPATNLTAVLLANNGVFPVTASANYGAIARGASVTKNFSFTNTGVLGPTVTPVLSLADNAYPLGTASFTILNPAPLTLSFANSALISIPDASPATPYPSAITVSATNMVIANVTAALQGFTHTFPHDVNVLLTSPSGQQAVLMAHVGGPYSVTNLVLAFSGAVTNSLTTGSLIADTNQPNLPTQLLPLDHFPLIFGVPSNTNLSVFNGGNPNGVWSLYVYDDTNGNSGSIANGWTLGLTLVNPASLGLGMTRTADPVWTGNYLTFQATVTNLGPYSATTVALTDTLPAKASLISASGSQGTVNTNVPGFVTFDFGALANPGDTATASIQVLPLQAGSAANAATVTDDAGLGASASSTATVTTPPPFSVQAAFQARNLTLTLEGETGQNYIIQVSTNLTTWTSIATNTAIGAGQFTLTNSLTNAARFYRALHLPQ